MRFSDWMLVLCFLPGIAVAQSPEEVTETTRHLFGASVRLEELDLRFGSEARAILTRRNDGAHPWEKVSGWRVLRNGVTAGAVFVDNVKGKARPITYLVAFHIDGGILGMEVLRYRESHGGEIRSPMFREQFTGKSAADAIRIGADIRNISGATISCRSVTRGARALATLMQYLMEERIL
ncbi:MAG: FMN-binding protein [Bacteroidetes bacterium]|nr:FMN-binding protein [Bacteroidota bacterium]